jgi:ABC-type multidrug transport system permease subunit
LAAPSRLGVLAGYTLAAMVRAFVTGLLLFAVGIATGMQVDGSGVDLFGLIVLALLVNFTAAMWAAGVAMRLRTIQAGPAMQMPVFIILFLAPVYVPLELLSGWVEAVAHLNPFTALVDGGRDFIAGTDVNFLLVFGCALGLGALFLAWAVRGVRAAELAG